MHCPEVIDGPRHSLIPPIPELEVVADRLLEAVLAVRDADKDRARDKLREADLQVVFDYSHALMNGHDRALFRKRVMATRLQTVRRLQVRMPPAAVIKSIYTRDGWRCRFCGCRVVQKEARDRLRALLPGAIRWNEAEGFHAAFYALTATPDHVLPHSVGGTNELENIVTACWPCNFGRGANTVEELGLIDPRTRPPVVDQWDGLTSVLRCPAPIRPRSEVAERSAATQGRSSAALHLRPEPRQDRRAGWATRIDEVWPGVSGELLAFAESCFSLGVSHSINKVMVLRLPTADGPIAPIGIDPELGVLIPWSVGPHKQASRAFAEAIAAAVPGAVAYETPMMWNVRKRGGNGKLENLSPLDLLEASDPVRAALEELGTAAMGPPNSAR